MSPNDSFGLCRDCQHQLPIHTHSGVRTCAPPVPAPHQDLSHLFLRVVCRALIKLADEPNPAEVFGDCGLPKAVAPLTRHS